MFAFFLLAFSPLLHADHTIVIDAPNSAEEMLKNPKMDGETPIGEPCVDQAGDTINPGEVDYDACIHFRKNKKKKPQAVQNNTDAMLSDPSLTAPPSSPPSVSRTCRDSDGEKFEPGDTGYDGCVYAQQSKGAPSIGTTNSLYAPNPSGIQNRGTTNPTRSTP